MSFRDVSHEGERRRQHPIFDAHRRSPTIIITPKKKNNHNRRVEMNSNSGDTSWRKTSSMPLGKAPSTQPIKDQRGVRPRLSTSCPVTAKILMDDQASLGSKHSLSTQETMDTYSSRDEAENPAVLPIRSKSSHSPKSVFAHLTTSIFNFQKMVAELERLLDDAGTSPETQWRTRILIRSAQDADRDIQARLYNLSDDAQSSRQQVALRKLHRDCGRVHTHLGQVLQRYQTKQQVEVSFLSKEEAREDFFDRAMREREQEVMKIHKSMNQVNSIYQDLAAMVDGQQEQIDKVAENMDEAKINTRAGLGQVQQGFLNFCGPVDGVIDEDIQMAQRGEEGYRVNEEFQWTMPFETLGDDMMAVQADVLRFGRDLVEGRLLETGCSAQAFECHDQFGCETEEPAESFQQR